MPRLRGSEYGAVREDGIEVAAVEVDGLDDEGAEVLREDLVEAGEMVEAQAVAFPSKPVETYPISIRTTLPPRCSTLNGTRNSS